MGGKGHWLHSVSNALWTCFYPHEKRGMEAMIAMGILADFNGVLYHDHWKPYFTNNQGENDIRFLEQFKSAL